MYMYIYNFSTGKPSSTEILIVFASDIFRRKSLIQQLFSFKLFWYANFLIVDSDDNNLSFKVGIIL